MPSISRTSAAVQVERAALASMPSNLRRSFLRLISPGDLFNAHDRDPVPVHAGHREAPASELHGLTFLRDMSEPEKHVSGNGLESGVGRQLDSITPFQIENAGCAVQIHLIGFGARLGELLVEFILDLAYDLFE